MNYEDFEIKGGGRPRLKGLAWNTGYWKAGEGGDSVLGTLGWVIPRDLRGEEESETFQDSCCVT